MMTELLCTSLLYLVTSMKRFSASLKLITFQIAFKYCKYLILARQRQVSTRTHVGFNVLVLQVERVLPNIDTDDGNMG